MCHNRFDYRYIFTYVCDNTVRGHCFTFLIFGAILFIISVTYFIISKKKFTGKIIAAVIAIALGVSSCFIGVAFWDAAVIEEDESIYNYLRVEKERNSYILSTNVMFGVQSISIEGDGLTGMYYDKALVAPVTALDGSPLDICILGLGTGTFATQCLRYFDCGRIDGVEIDEKIVNLAYKYFGLSDKVNAIVDDGRSFITYTDNTYDVIMVDAYRDITIPFQMSSIEFFRQVYDHLNDNGVMVVNFNMDTISEDSINDYLASTINNVFDRVYLLHSNTNVELFACKNIDFMSSFDSNVDKIESKKLRQYMNSFYGQITEYTRNDLVLTDDKAPVEMLGIKVLDEMIMDEIPDVKKMLKENSLKDLWEMLVNGEF